MDSFKEYLEEGWFGFGKKKKVVTQDDKPSEPASNDKPKGGVYGGGKINRHRDHNGDVETMETGALHTAYNRMRATKGTRDHPRYKALEAERVRRGFKPRTHSDHWDEYQKTKPKPRIHWTDAKGNKHSGG